MEESKKQFPPQEQETQPGIQTDMKPEPLTIYDTYKGSEKLKDKVALITGGDSGIGRAAAVHFAREGADVVIVYFNEDTDAEQTKKLIVNEGRSCLLIKGDIGEESFCKSAIEQTIDRFQHLDILVNNSAEQHPQKNIENITEEQLVRTFRTNIFSFFFMTKAAMKYLHEGSSIINTSSVTMYKGSPELLDYSSTKGAIVAFTRSLSQNLAEKKIRVNAVAPGPIWTPLIPSTFDKEKVSGFGSDVPLGRAGQPADLGPTYVYLASNDSSYVTGQTLHVNGGEVVNG